MGKFLQILALLFFLSIPFSLKGQPQTIVDKLVREYRPNSYWLTLRYDQYFKSGSFFFIENNNRFQKDADYLLNSFFLNSMHRTFLMAGYEYKAAEKWYVGISGKYILDANRNQPNNRYFYTRANISHRGNFLKMKFIKEIALEHNNKLNKPDNPAVFIQNEGRFSFAPALVKKINIVERPLFIILNYRAFIFFDFNNDGFSPYNKRKFDKTELRFELDYRISNKVLLSLFAIRDTDYSYRIASYDMNMNVIKEEARVNYVTPTFGLSINLTIDAPEDFIPGFPIK